MEMITEFKVIIILYFRIQDASRKILDAGCWMLEVRNWKLEVGQLLRQSADSSTIDAEIRDYKFEFKLEK